MSLQAYQKARSSAESPRDAEYRLFGQVTAALIEAGQKGRADMRKLIDAIDWNRRMWSAFATDCATEGNGLPVPLRAQIISLSIWVSRYSSQVIREGEPMEPLIDINRTIMAGLAPRS